MVTTPIDQIRRLLQVAEQTHHEGEAQNARSLARKLQLKHGLTDEQIASKPKPESPFRLIHTWTTTSNTIPWQWSSVHITYDAGEAAAYTKFMRGMAEVRAQLQATEDVFGWQRWYEDSTGKQPSEGEWQEAYREALRRRREQHGVVSDGHAEFAGYERVANRRTHQSA